VWTVLRGGSHTFAKRFRGLFWGDGTSIREVPNGPLLIKNLDNQQVMWATKPDWMNG